MRCAHTLVFLLAFLAGCATASPKPRERDPVTSAPGRGDAAPVAALETARTYRSAMAICFDGALKLCRDRDYRVVSQQSSASISARAPSFEFTLTFARTPENRTRVSIKTMPESRDEASRILDQLYDTLLEPKQ